MSGCALCSMIACCGAIALISCWVPSLCNLAQQASTSSSQVARVAQKQLSDIMAAARSAVTESVLGLKEDTASSIAEWESEILRKNPSVFHRCKVQTA
jgi:hypothetical protein